jgi:hypothetical protein
MTKSERAWEKAAACANEARQAPDDMLRAKFERLRDSWIRIANASASEQTRSQSESLQVEARFRSKFFRGRMI